MSFERASSRIGGERSAVIRIAATEADEDYPALAPAPDGGVWAVWISFVGNGERLLLAKVDEKGVSAPRQVNEGLGELYRPQVAVDGAGRVWVVWPEFRNENWDLYARNWHEGRWSPPQRLTTDSGPDTHPTLAVDGQGTVWLVWQGHRNAATSDIFLTSCRDGKWRAEPAVVGSHPSSDWEPAIAAGSDGSIHVAWTSYRHGSHDIFYAVWRKGRLTEPRALTGGNRLHIRPSLAVDRRNRLWIAWEEGAENWGKDTVQMKGGLHIQRKIQVRCLDGGRLLEPAETFEQAQTLWTGVQREHVRLQADASGRLWAFYRINFMQRYWQEAAMVYEGERWRGPVVLERSLGRQAVYASAALAADGTVWIAYAGDNRTEEDPFAATQNDVVVSRIPPSGAAATDPATGEAVSISPPAGRPYQRTWPEHRVEAGGKTFRLVWGELHKHTDINHHGRPDGSLEDAYRYARDAADLDFFATTDHIAPALADGVNPMTWWRSQKYADLHRVAGKFETLYAYESSKRGPQGHRNVVFPRRGGVIFGGIPGPTVNDPRPLWRALRESPAPAIAIPHQLTDSEVSWEIFDEAYTPILELYQSRRQNYEYDGAPQPPGVEQVWGKKAGSWAWDALAMGRKVGFIASTDHMSSHMAYAAAYVEELSREGVFRALQQRHTYAASENIVLDFRLENAGGYDRLMGEEVQLDGPRRFRIYVAGTALVERVEVVRNGGFVWSYAPGTKTAEMTYADTAPPAVESYYYVRIRQQDGHLAWSSPIWVRE